MIDPELSNTAEPIPAPVLNGMLKDADLNANDEVDYPEFVGLFQRGVTGSTKWNDAQKEGERLAQSLKCVSNEELAIARIRDERRGKLLLATRLKEKKARDMGFLLLFLIGLALCTPFTGFVGIIICALVYKFYYKKPAYKTEAEIREEVAKEIGISTTQMDGITG